MEPIKFPGCNTIFGEGQSEYNVLPAFKDDIGQVLSCWRPTSLRQFLRLIFSGGKVYLLSQTFGDPLQPIQVLTENPLVLGAEPSPI